MVAAVSNSTSTASAGSLTDAMGAAGNLGKTEFLKLLVEELKNQDPLKPKDDTAFVAELAQFSSLEQSMGINSRLDTITTQNTGMQNSQIVGMVGSKATVKGGMVTSNGTGTGVGFSFSLNGNADSVQVKIVDQSGRVVRNMDLGARKDGVSKIMWDGRSDEGLVQPEGSFQVNVTAKKEDGTSVAISQETSAVIDAVSFDKGYPVLHLSNGVAVPVSDLLKVESPTR